MDRNLLLEALLLPPLARSLHITDNGLVIEEQYHERILKLFQRRHPQEIPGSKWGRHHAGESFTTMAAC